LAFAPAEAFFGGFIAEASLVGCVAGFSCEAKVIETLGFCILGSSSVASSLDSDNPGLRQTNPQKQEYRKKMAKYKK
jgi:hypothetical protein